MHDLNDFRYFEAVVRNGGFNAASRDLGVSKSTLSRRILALEQDLGVRLIERTTHSFAVTTLGREFYEKCRIAVAELQSAELLATAMSAEPRGLVTVACLPGACAATLGAGLPDFLASYPKVRIRVVVGQRRTPDRVAVPGHARPGGETRRRHRPSPGALHGGNDSLR